MSNVDLAMSVVLGIGLAAATGFRLFLPLLILSGAAYTGHVSLDESFAWLGTPAAIIMLGTAATAEAVAFYIPGVDNLLDTLATPGAVVAGTVMSAAVITDLPPIMKWTAAVIAGGGDCRHHAGCHRDAKGKIHGSDGRARQPSYRNRRTRRCLAHFASGPGSTACRPCGGCLALLVGIPSVSRVGKEPIRGVKRL